MSAAEVIAEALRSCGIEESEKVEVPDILDALQAARYAVVELPKPETESPYSWLDGSVTATRGLGRVRLYQEDHRLTSADAREVAAALLAAADAAERTTETSVAIPPAAVEDPAGCIPPQSAGSPHLK